MSFLYLTQIIIVLLSLFIFSGCGDETNQKASSSQTTPTLSSFYPQIDEKCVTCHSPNGQEADGPDMSTPQKFVENLVGKKQSDYPNWYITSDCSQSLPFITAKDANRSTLMASLTQEDSDIMEKNYNCTSSFNVHDVNHASIAKGTVLYNDLTEWINAGALNN